MAENVHEREPVLKNNFKVPRIKIHQNVKKIFKCTQTCLGLQRLSGLNKVSPSSEEC